MRTSRCVCGEGGLAAPPRAALSSSHVLPLPGNTSIMGAGMSAVGGSAQPPTRSALGDLKDDVGRTLAGVRQRVKDMFGAALAVFAQIWARQWEHAWFRFAVLAVLLSLFVLFFVLHLMEEPLRIISFSGLFVILGTCFLWSEDRSKVSLRQVAGGLLLQMMLGSFIMKTQVGYDLFDWLGAEVNALLAFSDMGANFVFGICPYKHTVNIYAATNPCVLYSRRGHPGNEQGYDGFNAHAHAHAMRRRLEGTSRPLGGS